MKLTKNQLAMAAYVCVNGADHEVSTIEANAMRDAFRNSNDFDASIEDWKFILSLYSSGQLSWDEVAGQVKRHQLLTRFKMVQLIAIGANAEKEDWGTFNKFLNDIDVELDAYNAWNINGGKA